jgi:hypothetical protein
LANALDKRIPPPEKITPHKVKRIIAEEPIIL